MTDKLPEESCFSPQGVAGGQDAPRIADTQSRADKVRHASINVQALLDDNERLRAVIERLGSSEAMTLPFFISDNSEGRELRERMTFARAALTGDSQNG